MTPERWQRGSLWSFLFLLFLASLLAACGAVPAASPPMPSTPTPAPTTTPAGRTSDRSTLPDTDTPGEKVLANLSRQVDQMFAFIGKDEPGATLLVVVDGGVWHKKGYGLANVEEGIPNTPSTIFHLASVGKQFTGLAMIMLHEQGNLDYDASIAAYLPELQGTAFEDITVRHLLHHTSGLVGHESDDSAFYDALLEYADEPTNEDELAVLIAEGENTLTAAPGDAFDYSNLGYELAGLIVERVSGQSFGAFLRQHVQDPLGMGDTFSYDASLLDNPNRAIGYDVVDEQIEVYDSDPTDALVGSGSVYSSLDDLYLYDQALFGNRLVSQDALAVAFEPTLLNDGSEYPYGFGWDLYNDETPPFVEHEGVWLGFISHYAHVPDERMSIILLANRSDIDSTEMVHQVATIYLNHLNPTAEP